MHTARCTTHCQEHLQSHFSTDCNFNSKTMPWNHINQIHTDHSSIELDLASLLLILTEIKFQNTEITTDVVYSFWELKPWQILYYPSLCYCCVFHVVQYLYHTPTHILTSLEEIDPYNISCIYQHLANSFLPVCFVLNKSFWSRLKEILINLWLVYSMTTEPFNFSSDFVMLLHLRSGNYSFHVNLATIIAVLGLQLTDTQVTSNIKKIFIPIDLLYHK